MAPYACPNCARLLHFEARVCPACAFTLGFDPGSDRFLFLGDGLTAWRDADGAAHDVVVCANNNSYEICNWLVGSGEGTALCRACRYNRTIPDLTGPNVPARWRKIEEAKRRLVQELLKLRVPAETMDEAAQGKGFGLAFDLLYDPVGEESGTVQITTGHEAGLVTLNLIEADDAKREAMRTGLGEPYRTLLGHFRHEVGHYVWARLVEFDPEELAACRAVFGDDSISYDEAREKRYGGDGGGWTDDFVSSYATMHPWEDFAETFAHLMHIIDALATIQGFGMRMTKWPGEDKQPSVDLDPYRADTEVLVDEWKPFSFAENSIARSMGQVDLYPFHLSPAIVAKLDYVNRLLAKNRTG